MARSDKLYTNPRSKAGDEPDKREAKKGDAEEFDGEEWESMGTETLTKDNKIVSPDGLDRNKPPLSVKNAKETEDLRVKDSDDGRTREWFRRKPQKPTS